MNDEIRLQQRLREYVAQGPATQVSFDAVVALGRRSRRRRRLAAASGLTALALVAGGAGVYAVGGDPDRPGSRQPALAESPHADPKAIRSAFTQGVQDRLDSGTAEPGEISWYGRHLGGESNTDAFRFRVHLTGTSPGWLSGIITRGDARPGGLRRCVFYEWASHVCRSVDVEDGTVLVVRNTQLDTDLGRDDSLGQQDMDVIFIRDDWTGTRLTQYNFDPDDPQDAASEFPLTTAEAISLVQDPALDYRG